MISLTCGIKKPKQRNQPTNPKQNKTKYINKKTQTQNHKYEEQTGDCHTGEKAKYME